jgi:small subunit ribosomal protein S9
MEKSTYFSGTGRRKTSTAQVILTPGNGTIIINGIPYEELFSRVQHRQAIIQPFVVTENTGKYNVVVNVAGGGLTGQSGAISHGIARALLAMDQNLRLKLRQNGLLTRDPRVKERKKPGLKRARKAKQYTKR